MKLFGRGGISPFKKKAGREAHVPVAEVEGMLKTGTPEPAIRDMLKTEGYTDADITKALDGARVKIGAGGPQQQFAPPWQQAAPPAGQAYQEAGFQQEPAPLPAEVEGPAPWGQGFDAPGEAAPPEHHEVATEIPTVQDFEHAMHPMVEGLRHEMDTKFNEIEADIRSIRETEQKLSKIISDLEEMKGNYAHMTEHAEDMGKYEDELAELKGSVDSVLEILKNTLPPVIKTLKELKAEGETTSHLEKKKKEVKHLL